MSVKLIKKDIYEVYGCVYVLYKISKLSLSRALQFALKLTSDVKGARFPSISQTFNTP